MKRRVLLVDDEISILLTLKAVLEISGFIVDTAASAREAKMLLRHREYDMIITDMRMENDAAGAEVIAFARTAHYSPAVALLSAYPVAEEDWQGMGADQMLVKPMQTHALLHQMEALLVQRADRLAALAVAAPAKKPATKASPKKAVKKTPAKKAAKKSAVKKPAKKVPAKKKSARKPLPKKSPAKKKTPARKPAKKKAAKKSSRRR